MRGTLLLKLLFVPLLVLGVLSFAPSAHALNPDKDGDSVLNTVENSAPNDGDNNYDNKNDSKQNTVASIPNPNDTEQPDAYVTLQVGETYQPWGEEGPTIADSAWKIDKFEAVDVATLPTQPDGKVFPLGMFDIELSCIKRHGCYEKNYSEVPVPQFNDSIQPSEITSDGCVWVPIPADLTLIFNRVMDTSNWTMQKYDPSTGAYIDYSPYVSIETENNDFGYTRTVLKWSITDNEMGDDDPTVGKIKDPIGPSVPVATPVVSTTPATIVASTVSPVTLQHTGNNLAIYSIILGFLMIGLGAVIVRKS